jgi:hypothetical protein
VRTVASIFNIGSGRKAGRLRATVPAGIFDTAAVKLCLLCRRALAEKARDCSFGTRFLQKREIVGAAPQAAGGIREMSNRPNSHGDREIDTLRRKFILTEKRMVSRLLLYPAVNESRLLIGG